MAKILIIIGILLVFIGILVSFRFPIPFGKLPDDIAVKGEHVQFYFPTTSSMILSIVLSILFYLFSSYVCHMSFFKAKSLCF